MAKKKRIKKPNNIDQDKKSEPPARTRQSASPKSNTPYLIIIASLLLVIAYLLSGGGPNQTSTPASPAVDTPSQPLLYTGDIPELKLKPEFSEFFPDNISGVRRVKLQMDPLSDETGGQFISKVADRANVLYLRDSTQTDFEVEYSVYKMESPEAADQVLDFYTSQWNNIPAQYGNVTFWIWNGYTEQIQSGGKARAYGTPIYWDTLSNAAFLPIGGRDSNYFISNINQTLYCLHGETAHNEYFIMVDVHASVQDINSVSDQFFEEAATQINSQLI